MKDKTPVHVAIITGLLIVIIILALAGCAVILRPPP